MPETQMQPAGREYTPAEIVESIKGAISAAVKFLQEIEGVVNEKNIHLFDINLKGDRLQSIRTPMGIMQRGPTVTEIKISDYRPIAEIFKVVEEKKEE